MRDERLTERESKFLIYFYPYLYSNELFVYLREKHSSCLRAVINKWPCTSNREIFD